MAVGSETAGGGRGGRTREETQERERWLCGCRLVEWKKKSKIKN